MQALTVFVARRIFLAAIIRNALFVHGRRSLFSQWSNGCKGVVVVTDSILTSSKVQSLSLLQLKRMHLMHLMHLLSPLSSSGNFDAVRACFPAFSRTLAPVSVLLQGKTRSSSRSCRASLVLSSRYIYTHIAITFIVIDKGPALVVVAAVFRTSHISHTFESGGCRTS